MAPDALSVFPSVAGLVRLTGVGERVAVVDETECAVSRLTEVTGSLDQISSAFDKNLWRLGESEPLKRTHDSIHRDRRKRAERDESSEGPRQAPGRSPSFKPEAATISGDGVSPAAIAAARGSPPGSAGAICATEPAASVDRAPCIA